MKQITTRNLARISSSNKSLGQAIRIPKITQLSRLSSTMEPLEGRMLMSASVLALPPAAVDAGPVKVVNIPVIAPSNLTITNQSRTQISLSWKGNDTTATGYSVLRSTDAKHFSVVGNLAGEGTTTFTCTGLTAGSKYEFQVQAVRKTLVSNTSATVTAITSLAAPSTLRVTAVSATQNNLVWVDNDASATGYIVLRSNNGAAFSQLAKLNGANIKSYSDTTATANSNCYYEIEATTAAAVSPASGMALSDAPLQTPTNLSGAASSPTSATITWKDSDSKATGYQILRSVNSGAFSQVATIASAKTTSWTDTSLSSNKTYSYEVKASNGIAVSGTSVVFKLITPLIAPTKLVATVTSSGGIGLTWTGNDPTATGYAILRSTDGVHFFLLNLVSGGSSHSYTDTTVSAGTTYSYVVAATATQNTSAMSNMAVATITKTVVAPTGLTGTASTANSVVLNWTDHDSTATGYNILRSTDGKTFTQLTKLTTGSANTYTDTTVASASTYYYQVQAFNPTSTSTATSAVSVTTPLLAPTGLVATVSGSTIKLTWTDKDSAATGYKVMRSTNGTTFTLLTQLSGASTASYTDTTAAAGQKYYYQVQAVSSSNSSPVSNTVNATVAVASPTPSPAPSPAPSTSGVTIATRYTNELVISATGTADSVSITESNGTLNIVADGTTTTDPVPLDGLFVYARGGKDSINIDATVAVRTTVESIDGVVDNITSSGSDVSVWDDSNDIFTGTGTVHSVASFAGSVSKAAGASLKDPSDSGTVMQVSASLWGAGPVAGDVNQGNSGDCYFLSSLAAFAGVQPAMLQESAVDMGDGTYTVQYENSSNQPQFIRVSNDLPTRGSGSFVYARPGSTGSIWAAIMEKAYAFFRTGANTYASITSGWMGNVYSALGINNSFFYLSGMTQAQLYSKLSTDLANGKAVTLGTVSNAPNLVSGHAYTLISASVDKNGVTSYVVRNPWGVQGDSLENAQGYATLTFAQMLANFSDACEAT